MKAIILAAGRGSRMKNLTRERPKCLVELRGKPLIEHQITSLREAGIQEIAIVTGYRREMIADYGDKEFYNENWASTNMVGSLCKADEWLRHEDCIVTYSDIFYDPSAVTSLMQSSASLAITYDINWLRLWQQRFGDPLLDAETFRLHEDGSLAEIGNKPDLISQIEGQYMGLLRFTPSGWAACDRIISQITQEQFNLIHMTGLLQKIIKAGYVTIQANPYDGEWGEIDSQNDLANYKS
jgi:choline kinase